MVIKDNDVKLFEVNILFDLKNFNNLKDDENKKEEDKLIRIY